MTAKAINPSAWRPSSTERASSAWQQVFNHLSDRLANLRKENDNDLSEVNTAKLRGKIQEVKRLMALNDDLPKPE